MGLGVGAVVETGTAQGRPGGSYIAFIAPALMVASGMQIAASESLWPLASALDWERSYHGVAATPLRPAEIVAGHVSFTLVRVALPAVVIGTLLIVGLDEASTVGTVAAVGVAVLVGAAFAGPIMAMTARTLSHVVMIALMRLGIVPLFLFSGTFFPIERLPAAAQPVAMLSPLWHGVELARAAVVGAPTTLAVGAHIAVLVAVAAVGAVLAERAFRRELQQ